MKKEIRVHDHWFERYLSAEQIRVRVDELGREIGSRYAGRNPLFIVVLNGAFMFAADLVRAAGIECEMAFVRLSSYRGLETSGLVKTLIGLDVSLKGRDVIVVEDIIDSGNTMAAFLPDLHRNDPGSVALAALLLKPDCLKHPIGIEYLGFEIPDKFVVGYGLDYDGYGRGWDSIYQIRQ
jgi:hypoxanthine phosphoribosyltransferase